MVKLGEEFANLASHEAALMLERMVLQTGFSGRDATIPVTCAALVHSAQVLNELCGPVGLDWIMEVTNSIRGDGDDDGSALKEASDRMDEMADRFAQISAPAQGRA